MSDLQNFGKKEQLIAEHEHVAKLLQKIADSGSLGELSGLSKQHQDNLYALSYNLYQAQNYDQALALFAMLALFEPSDSKYLLGQAGCYVGLKNYEKAFEVYQMAFLIDSLVNPEPLYQAAICLIKMGRKEEAYELLDVAESCGKDGNERHALFKGKCQELRSMLELGIKNQAKRGV